MTETARVILVRPPPSWRGPPLIATGTPDPEDLGWLLEILDFGWIIDVLEAIG